ncbi:receptor-interacting serine/threonine-protein kinase 2 [Latimeria chalumnae]|uniref:receptor-interacting serine/threonine-protein kinase 2 n=1 Tax=Latimeria chalumnae TaxID=7897 RepID=UPI00313D30C1
MADLVELQVSDYGLSHWRRKCLKSIPLACNGPCGEDVVYLAPERLCGEEPSAQGDIFGFGVMSWEAISRRKPYEDKRTLMQVVSAINGGVRPDTGAEFIPAALPQRDTVIQLVSRCWAQEPRHRPSFTEIVATLQRVVNIFSPKSASRAFCKFIETKERALESCKAPDPQALHIDINNMEVSTLNLYILN